MSKELIDKIKVALEKDAKLPDYQADDDFTAYDYSGSNVDDAFEMGITQGYGDQARFVLTLIREYEEANS